ncbi:MAG: hypothetical protein COV10_02055 [Candidatus Vogelbacteria bacterium CG10_big_fil_rev_8_21_14_0_10_51_16]|uniref:Class I SAM-dependent methyltransferase n=1 Tax=Candidatus Vogelbacteria bacterium CG10_big_fil_rev_8_21_14_0_10_51_16 TaxID=1975045 RepID=A0A2H0REM4_9BACT|nr:MAG: hypothetical protein COV10_02055 [Candidatus Vogelbacteria bacterium CG10_big_fil_rev_8_21_14_0_10_51_16]
MNELPKNCIVCSHEPMRECWNDINVLVCGHCGLAWRETFDIPSDYYTELNAERGAPSESKMGTRLSNARDRLMTVKRFLPPRGICDVGCGEGLFLSALDDAGYTKCWGIEPNVLACHSASQAGYDIVLGGLTDLPSLRIGRDLRAITLFHVLEHLPDPGAALRLIHEMIPAGGIVVLETPDSEAYLQRATKHRNHLVYQEHLFYWNERSLQKILKQEGFRVVAISRRSFDWENTPIRSSLVRLGVPGFKAKQTTFFTSKSSDETRVQEAPTQDFIRCITRKMLARLVRLLKRDDYILVVAERT